MKKMGLKASDKKKLKSNREKIDRLSRAVTKLQKDKETLNGLKTEGLLTAGSDQWRGEEQTKFKNQYDGFTSEKKSVKSAIDTAIDDYNAKIRALEASDAAITGNPYMT